MDEGGNRHHEAQSRLLAPCTTGRHDAGLSLGGRSSTVSVYSVRALLFLPALAGALASSDAPHWPGRAWCMCVHRYVAAAKFEEGWRGVVHRGNSSGKYAITCSRRGRRGRNRVGPQEIKTKSRENTAASPGLFRPLYTRAKKPPMRPVTWVVHKRTKFLVVRSSHGAATSAIVDLYPRLNRVSCEVCTARRAEGGYHQSNEVLGLRF